MTPAQPAGLIDTAIDGTKETDVLDPGKTLQATAVGYDPERTAVNLETDTVSGQLDQILGEGSSYLDRARAGATQYANSRGLINSSMAAGAGEAAAIDAALPIASQDANTFTNTRLTNQAAGNTASQFTADATNRAGLVNATAAQDLARQREAGETQMDLQTLRGDQANTLANIEGQYRTLIQTSASASALYQDVTRQITLISADPNLSASQKSVATQNLASMLESGLTIAGAIADLDLAGLLDFS